MAAHRRRVRQRHDRGGADRGDAVKVWFLRPHVPYRESVASVIIAKTTLTLSQALFLLMGVGPLALAVDARLVR
jgi:hypothetical protein